MQYKFEIHLHTSSCSACARATAKELLDDAKSNGYSGIVITNHFYYGNTCIDRRLPWEKFVEAYAEDFNDAKAYGEKIGMTVFFGIEEGYAPGKEMLIYGISPDDLINCNNFLKMNLKEKVDFIHKKGGITVCAHPFRDRAYIPNPNAEPDPTIFDGIECYNQFNGADANDKALAFAEKHNLLKFSGGDVHQTGQIRNYGIAFNKPIKNYKDFIKKIKANQYEMILP